MAGGCRGSWSASIDGRVVCPSVRSPFVAAAKALLAEGHAPETEIAMKHEGSTIVAMRGKIGALSALADEAATPGRHIAAPNGLAGRRSR